MNSEYEVGLCDGARHQIGAVLPQIEELAAKAPHNSEKRLRLVRAEQNMRAAIQYLESAAEWIEMAAEGGK